MSSLLLFDVGGTHLRGVHYLNEEKREVIKETHASFASFLEWFKQSTFKEIHPSKVVIAAAGPSNHEHLVMTNLPWSFNRAELEAFFHCPVHLLNDLEAAVYLLPKAEAYISLQGQPKKGVKGLIAPGTGLGEAFIIPNGNKWIPMPTEGGQALFTPPIDLGQTFFRLEELLSGPGLSLIHQKVTGKHLSPEQVIHQSAEARNIFIDLLLQEASSFALRTLAKGGVFLGGAIIRALSPYLQEKGTELFYRHPTMEQLLRSIPLLILTGKDKCLEGARIFAQEKN